MVPAANLDAWKRTLKNLGNGECPICNETHVCIYSWRCNTPGTYVSTVSSEWQGHQICVSAPAAAAGKNQKWSVRHVQRLQCWNLQLTISVCLEYLQRVESDVLVKDMCVFQQVKCSLRGHHVFFEIHTCAHMTVSEEVWGAFKSQKWSRALCVLFFSFAVINNHQLWTVGLKHTILHKKKFFFTVAHFRMIIVFVCLQNKANR